jgi:hypothetical protein
MKCVLVAPNGSSVKAQQSLCQAPDIAVSSAGVFFRLVLTLAILLTAYPAAAESEPIRIVYRADADCPSQSEFQAEVLGRTSRARIADDADSARVFDVELVRSGSQVVGSLVVHEADGATVARRVSGRNCADVAKVLALATALAIDPRAELASKDAESRDSESRDSESRNAAAESPRASGVTERAAPRAPAAAAPNVPQSPSRLRITEPPKPWIEPEWFGQVSLGGRAVFGIGPRPSLGAVLTLGTLPNLAGLPLAVDLGVAWVETLSTRVSGAQANFRFVSARPRLCAQVFHPLPQLTLGPCVAVELGLVTAAGSNLPRSDVRNEFWAAGEAIAELALQLGGGWFLGLDLAAVFPFTRYTYVFAEPETSVYVTPVVGASATFGVGAQF